MNADWSDLQLLDRIARAGTLSAAARALGVDQTTVSRRLAALERRLGAALFDRVGARLAPTPVLAAALDRLAILAETAEQSFALLRNATAELRGTVRVTSVATVLAAALAPALGALLRDHPGLRVEFLAEDHALSFARREADVAIRLGGGGEDDAVEKSLGRLRFVLCRAAGAEAPDPPVLRYAEDLAHTPEMRALAAARPGARVALACNRLEVLIAAARATGGEIMLPAPMLRDLPDFRSVGEVTAERPLRLLLHPERRRAPSVAAVAKWAEAALKAWRG